MERDEAEVQALALRHELGRHDQWAAAALEVAEILIAEERLVEAQRLIRRFRDSSSSAPCSSLAPRPSVICSAEGGDER